MSTILDALARELEQPREVSPQVTNHILGTYGIGRDEISSFLLTKLAGLEEYEIDLLFSPLFTPTLQDQAVFAEILGSECVPATRLREMVQQLVTRPTCAQFITDDQQTITVPLQEVTIERYVHRLRLDAIIPEPLFKLISHFPFAADRPMLKAIARRAIWHTESRQQILTSYLLKASSDESFSKGDAMELLKLMETYEPTDRNDLLARIPHWQQVLRQEINDGTGAKPFFNERVEELHGGGRDQRRRDNTRVKAKEDEQAFLERLQRVLAT